VDEVAKRLRDTETYKDRFVKSLPPDYKHLWFYILDDCDHAGIWRVDFEGASLYTGCNLNHPEAMRHLSEKVEILNPDYWFIPGFLKFQYGQEANGKAGVVISARKRLKEFGLEDRLPVSLDPPKTVPTPSQEGLGTPKSKSKDKSKVKDKELDLTEFEKFWETYPSKKAKQDALKAWNQVAPPLQAVLTSLGWQRKQEDWTKDSGKYVPLPGTYIRGKRWEDEKPGWAHREVIAREIHYHTGGEFIREAELASLYKCPCGETYWKPKENQ
jgi:hypothetical protein